MSRSRSAPIAWDSGRLGHCFRMVVPLRDTGTHLRMHRRLTPSLKREDTDRSHEGFDSCERILVRQKPAMKIFSCRVPLSRDEINEVTERLYKYDPLYRPPESERRLRAQHPVSTPQVMLSKPIYSTEEVRAIVARLQRHRSGPNDNARGERKEVKVRERYAYYTASEVEDIIDKVHNDPEERIEHCRRVGSARSCSYRSRSNSLVRSVSSAGTRPTREQIDGTTFRMTQPPRREPKRQRHQRGRRNSQEPPANKKVSDEELGVIVDRLNKFNTQRWPPESKPEVRKKTEGDDSN